MGFVVQRNLLHASSPDDAMRASID
jgi:hypothetical protein